MQKKQKPFSSSADARRATQNNPFQPKRSAERDAFPAVGMTLNGYTAPKSTRRGQNPVKPQSKFARFRSKFTKKRIIIGIVIIILAIVGWLGWKIIYNAERLFGGNIFSALTSTKLDGEDEGRVNILLAGNSADDIGHQGATLTDSIMVISIDTRNSTAFMMSIPRDLYVRIPGNGYGKINSVFPAGERSNFSEDDYAEGGMGLLQKVIEDNIGLKTHYNALVNYTALREAVDSVGGVDVTIQSTDRRGLYDSSKDYYTGGVLVRLSNGKHTLNGQQALNLARARGEGRGSYGYANSDFTRTENQRKLILALRAKATSAGVLTNPVRISGLFDAIGGNVSTDLTLGHVRRLQEVTKGIDVANIQSIGLNDADGENLLENYRTSRGESALVPAAGIDDYGDIQAYIERITSTDPVVRENAKIVILNGTTTSGLAAQESDTLEDKKYNVVDIGDADTETVTTTQIIDVTKTKSGTRQALLKQYGGSTATTTNPYANRYDADIIVVIGSDRIPSSSSSNN